MRTPSRSKVSSFFLRTVLVVVTTCMLGIVFRGPIAGAASVSSSGASATKGTIVKVATINPSKLPTGKVPPASKPTLAIPYHSAPRTATKTAPSLPTAISVPLSDKSSLLHNFDALKSLDNQNVNGFQLEPPDQGLCVGNGFVMEAINIVGAVYRPDGRILIGPFGLQAFFGETPGITGTFVSDPRCYFDPSTNTWFATILAVNFQAFPPTTHLDLAVNPSGDPTTPWTVYRIDTTDTGHPGCPCLPDFPIFGIDQFNVYITTNEYPLFAAGFNGAQIYAVSKSQLVSLSTTVNIVQFSNLSTGGFPAYHLQPAITNGSAGAEFLMNSIPFDSIDNRLGLWAITNQEAVTRGGTPTLSNITLTSETYVVPSPAANPNGNYLNPDDDGLEQLQYINGNLWTSLDTAVVISGDTGSRDGAAWFEVHPKLSSDGTTISGGTFVNQGYVALKGNYLLYPAIVSSPDGTTALVFTVTGASKNPSAGYALLRPGAKAFGAIQIAAAGTTTDNGFTCGGLSFPCRWGDYSAGVIDPGTRNLWLATEYIPPVGASGANWGTRLFEVQA